MRLALYNIFIRFLFYFPIILVLMNTDLNKEIIDKCALRWDFLHQEALDEYIVGINVKFNLNHVQMPLFLLFLFLW